MLNDNNGKDDNVCQAHSGVVAGMTNLGRNIDQLREAVKLLTAKLDEFVQRPTWRITAIISVLSSLCSIMGTFILYSHFASK